MATARIAVSSRPTPLETTTNSPPNHTYPKHFGFPSSPARSKPLRRTNSLRRIQQKSGDSEPASPDSIYNAQRVESGETSPEDEAPFWLPPPAVPLQQPTHLHIQEPSQIHANGLSKSLSSRSPPLGYSNWPEPQLDTILEQSSTRSLRQSASAPRLQSSPERSAQYVKAKSSIHSIRPIRLDRTPWPREKPHPAAGLQRQHSFSTNDLDCLKRLVDSKDAGSSSVTLCPSPFCKLASQTPMFPVRPKHPPPRFPETPDGLPAFGSKEAQQLRLTEHKQQRHRARQLFGWLRGDHDSDEQRSGSNSNPVTSPTTRAEEHPPTDLLKRIFGMSRPVPAPDANANPHPRASLPPGVTTANSPSILAVADDGTAVRGKFGARASGHGVGSRALESHPMARVDRQAMIQEHVTEIDKACERINRGSERNHLRQLPQYPSIESELQRHVIRAQRERAGKISGLEGRRPTNSGESLRSPPIPPANSPSQGPTSPIRAPIMSTSTIDPSMFSGMRSQSSSMRMTEPR